MKINPPNHLDMCQKNGSWLIFLEGIDEEEESQLVVKAMTKNN